MSDSIFKSSLFTATPDQILFDYAIDGGFDINGQVNKVYNIEALNQALSIWLRLRKGELLYRPNTGGFTYSYLNKPLSNEGATGLKEAILLGIENDFFPKLNVLAISVSVDYENKSYNIYLKVQTKDLKIQSEFKESFKVNK